MVSWFQIAFIGGVTIYVIGLKNLPEAARVAGMTTGRAFAFVSAARQRFFKVAKDAEIDKLHEEIQLSMRQMQKIRQELRQGVRFMPPRGMMSQDFFKQGQQQVNEDESQGKHSERSPDQMATKKKIEEIFPTPGPPSTSAYLRTRIEQNK